MVEKSKYSYYRDFPHRNFSVCANFLTSRFTVFRNIAYTNIQDSMKSPDFHMEHSRGCELLLDSDYFKPAVLDEDQDFWAKWKSITEQDGSLSIVVFITDGCNFRCSYCCQDHATQVLSTNTQNQLILFLQKNLPNYRNLFIEWFGGEPLLYPGIIGDLSAEIISICHKYNIRYQSHITTNGYFLDADMIRYLRKNRVTSYQITLDGIRASHDQQRILADGSGTWDRIVKNLIEIRDNVRTPTISIMIRTNITKSIHHHKEEYLAFLKDSFSGDPRFHFLWKLAEDWGNIEQTNKNILCGIKEYHDVVSMANDIGLKTRFIKSTLTLGGRMCDAGKKNHFILYADGKIGKCARGLNPAMNHIGMVEDLVSQGDKILHTALKSKKGFQNKCQECVKVPLCLAQICPMEPMSNCGYEMENIDFILESIAMTDNSCVFKDK